MSNSAVCVFGCAYPIDQNISYYTFPLNSEVRKEWLEALEQPGFVPEHDSKVCSEHFVVLPDEDPYVVPLLKSLIKPRNTNTLPPGSYQPRVPSNRYMFSLLLKISRLPILYDKHVDLLTNTIEYERACSALQLSMSNKKVGPGLVTATLAWYRTQLSRILSPLIRYPDFIRRVQAANTKGTMLWLDKRLKMMSVVMERYFLWEYTPFLERLVQHMRRGQAHQLASHYGVPVEHIQRIWHVVCQLSTLKLQWWSWCGDGPPRVPPLAALVPPELSAALHQLLASVCARWTVVYNFEGIRALWRLLELARRYELEPESMDDLVPPMVQRWVAVYRDYCDSTMYCPLLVLQRRWLQLKTDARRCALEGRLLNPIHKAIIKRYPRVLCALPSWSALLGAGHVYYLTLEEIAAVPSIQPLVEDDDEESQLVLDLNTDKAPLDRQTDIEDNTYKTEIQAKILALTSEPELSSNEDMRNEEKPIEESTTKPLEMLLCDDRIDKLKRTQENNEQLESLFIPPEKLSFAAADTEKILIHNFKVGNSIRSPTAQEGTDIPDTITELNSIDPSNAMVYYESDDDSESNNDDIKNDISVTNSDDISLSVIKIQDFVSVSENDSSTKTVADIDRVTYEIPIEEDSNSGSDKGKEETRIDEKLLMEVCIPLQRIDEFHRPQDKMYKLSSFRSRISSPSRKSSPNRDSRPNRDSSPNRASSSNRDSSPNRESNPNQDSGPTRYSSPSRISNLKRKSYSSRDTSPGAKVCRPMSVVVEKMPLSVMRRYLGFPQLPRRPVSLPSSGAPEIPRPVAQVAPLANCPLPDSSHRSSSEQSDRPEATNVKKPVPDCSDVGSSEPSLPPMEFNCSAVRTCEFCRSQGPPPIPRLALMLRTIKTLIDKIPQAEKIHVAQLNRNKFAVKPGPNPRLQQRRKYPKKSISDAKGRENDGEQNNSAEEWERQKSAFKKYFQLNSFVKKINDKSNVQNATPKSNIAIAAKSTKEHRDQKTTPVNNTTEQLNQNATTEKSTVEQLCQPATTANVTTDQHNRTAVIVKGKHNQAATVANITVERLERNEKSLKSTIAPLNHDETPKGTVERLPQRGPSATSTKHQSDTTPGPAHQTARDTDHPHQTQTPLMVIANLMQANKDTRIIVVKTNSSLPKFTVKPKPNIFNNRFRSVMERNLATIVSQCGADSGIVGLPADTDSCAGVAHSGVVGAAPTARACPCGPPGQTKGRGDVIDLTQDYDAPVDTQRENGPVLTVLPMEQSQAAASQCAVAAAVGRPSPQLPVWATSATTGHLLQPIAATLDGNHFNIIPVITSSAPTSEAPPSHSSAVGGVRGPPRRVYTARGRRNYGANTNSLLKKSVLRQIGSLPPRAPPPPERGAHVVPYGPVAVAARRAVTSAGLPASVAASLHSVTSPRTMTSSQLVARCNPESP